MTTIGKSLFGSNNQFRILLTFVYVVVLICIIETIASSQKITAKIFSGELAVVIIPIIIILLFSRLEVLNQIFLPNILTVPYSLLFILMGICWYFAKDK